jgi:starch phosphorylase
MEIALEPDMPTYSGGLGILAGDTLRSAADLEVPIVAVTLLYRRGYFRQRLDAEGQQTEETVSWPVEKRLKPLDARVVVEIEDRKVQVRAWEYRIRGVRGFEVPVLLLDTQLPENESGDRELTASLYGGDARYRLCQEAVLGIGGARLLATQGHERLHRYHLNEGHAALLVLALMEREMARTGAPPEEALETSRLHCVFTTHTPVPAGHDQFPRALAREVLGERRGDLACGLCSDGLNMTALALEGSHYVNGVAMRHGEISRNMFPHYPIHSITNGVHLQTWASPPFQALFDRKLPDWRRDGLSLRYAISLSDDEIWTAHHKAKQTLIDYVNRRHGVGFTANRLTLGFARRATGYKRGTLIFHDLERLRKLAASQGGLQLVFAGKAHPHDQEGKEIIRGIHEAGRALGRELPVAYLEDYDMASGLLLTAGSDVWLNNPTPPQEASGTSGMKAAVNGVPSLSVLDGWWIEGHLEGVTGWAFGPRVTSGVTRRNDDADADALYRKLEDAVMPLYYKDRSAFINVMRHAIALNGSFFNTERMLRQYATLAYDLGPPGDPPAR